MSSVVTISTVASIGSQVYSADQARKAAHANQDQLKNLTYQPIDLNALQESARQDAAQNAAASLALEQQLEPNLAATRQGLQAQTAQDLASGGNLPTDVRNQVAKAAITGSNSSGLIGAGGPITAASLGLTALQLRNQNQAKAASLLQANPTPVAGLDPGSLASATIANNNAMNQFALSKAGVATNVNQSTANTNAALGGAVGSGIGGLAGVIGKYGGSIMGSLGGGSAPSGVGAAGGVSPTG